MAFIRLLLHDFPSTCLFIIAFRLCASTTKDNQFRRQYLRLTIEKGIPSLRAKLTVARSILATIYGIWKSGEDYDATIDKKRIESDKTQVRAYHLVRNG